MLPFFYSFVSYFQFAIICRFLLLLLPLLFLVPVPKSLIQITVHVCRCACMRRYFSLFIFSCCSLSVAASTTAVAEGGKRPDNIFQLFLFKFFVLL